MAFNNFPYTNFHELNADWMLETLKTLRNNVEAAIQSMESVLGSLEEYNQRLSNLETGAVMFTVAQARTAEEKATARENIGAISLQDLAGSAVRYDVRQQLTPTQQENARGNIGAAPSLGVVRYDTDQLLGDTNKTRARSNISALGVNELGEHAVMFTEEQNMTAAEQATARENIGAISLQDLAGSAVRYDVRQQLTPTQQENARGNIGAAPSLGVVRYDTAQLLDNAKKAQARENIGAISAADIPSVTGAVQYDRVQYLTESQKAQARTNIGVSGSEDQPLMVTVSPNEQQTGYECDTSVTDIIEAYYYGRVVIVIFTPVNENVIYQCVATIDPVASPNTVVAYAYNPEGPGALNEFNWYRIYMTAGSGSDTLSVNRLSGRLIPSSQASDAGMLLAVSNAGRPTWVQKDPTVVSDLVSSSITLAALDNTEYNYGELSALTITSIPTIGEFSIVFVSGSTPTTLSIPQTMIMPDNFSSVAANTRYEINVKNGYALVGSWEMSA